MSKSARERRAADRSDMITKDEAVRYADACREAVDRYFGGDEDPIPDDVLSMLADLAEYVREVGA